MENKIIQSIISKCKTRGYVVSPQLVSFYTKSIIFNKHHGFSDLSDRQDKLEDLITMSVERLCQQDSPQLETVKMQVSMDVSSSEYEKELEQKDKTFNFKDKHIVQDIITKKNELEVFGDMVIYIIHKTRMLDKSNEKIEKETMNALESVIPRDFVSSFIRQSESEKVTQLKELWKIVWGIKLYNKCANTKQKKEYETGKLGFFQLPLFFKEMKDLEKELKEFEEEIEKMYSYGNSKEGKNDVDSLNRIRKELVNRLQYYGYLKAFKERLKMGYERLALLKGDFDKKIEEISEIVTTHTSVEKSKIYPLFIKLSDLWKNSEEVVPILSRVKYLRHFLGAYKRSYNPMIESIDPNSFTVEKFVDKEIKVKEIDYMPKEGEKKPHRILPENHITKKQVFLNGFDPISIIRGNRLLRKMSDDKDLIFFEGRYFGFFSDENSEIFFNSPKESIEKLFSFVEIEPELIYLLGLTHVLPDRIIEIDEIKTGKKHSSGIQTDTHFMESHFDPSYHWSEWELRKRALKIADLRNKKTHSTQTDKSHFRREFQTQTYLPKETGTQTRKESGTNPKKHVRYVKNLRGKKDAKMKVVNLTFDKEF